jgi:hypothetical protein
MIYIQIGSFRQITNDRIYVDNYIIISEDRGLYRREIPPYLYQNTLNRLLIKDATVFYQTKNAKVRSEP